MAKASSGDLPQELHAPPPRVAPVFSAAVFPTLQLPGGSPNTMRAEAPEAPEAAGGKGYHPVIRAADIGSQTQTCRPAVRQICDAEVMSFDVCRFEACAGTASCRRRWR